MVMIRSAVAADLPPVLTLWRDADTEPSHTDDQRSLAQLIEHSPEALVVAETNGRIIGSVIAGWDGWRGSIYRLAVAPDQRRRELGRRLVTEAVRRLEERGAVRMQAIVVESDPLATQFWRSMDWEEQLGRLRFVKG